MTDVQNALFGFTPQKSICAFFKENHKILITMKILKLSEI